MKKVDKHMGKVKQVRPSSRSSLTAVAAPFLPLFISADLYPRPPRKVRALADDRHVVSAGEDGLVHVWDVGTGDLVHALDGHQGSAINFLAAAKGTPLCASVSSDRKICVWDALAGRLVSSVPTVLGGR